MIAINNIDFEFGGRYLYKGASWHIKPNERIGLVGRNGTGKSTLLRIINGEYSVNSGNISKPRGLSIGFLNQDNLSFESDESILHVAMQAFERALQLEIEIEQILKKMETDHSDAILNLLAQKQEEFEHLDGYNIHHTCEKVLEGLGFTTEQLNQPYKKFSGGWRMRVMLARMLLQKPTLLMLDEPTNHLDLPTIEWLEEYLKSYEGTVVVVSHDREFLDRMCTKTVEIANQRIYEYPGNYSFYLEAKQERIGLQQRQYDNQQQFIKEQEKLINRFKAKASKASMAQSRIKMLERIDQIDAPEEDDADVTIQFRVGQQSGRVVAELNHVSKRFPDVEILRNSHGKIEKGDKIALIGANGKGKSTLLRMIAGTEQFDGEIKPGYNLHTAFYAQHQLESLNLQEDILEEVKHHAPERTETELRTILGCFLFTGDDVFKKIKVLSGGEKARVALAKTLLTEANFLLLDEPTNHLDIRAINILISALQQYQGTFITVSHDRHFVSQIANKIWWIENHELKEYPGTYSEYEEWRRKNELQKQNEVRPVVKETKAERKEPAPEKTKPSNNQIQKVKQDFSKAESELENKKRQLAELESQFTLPENNASKDKLKDLQIRLEQAKIDLREKERLFEIAFERLLEIEEN